MPLLTELKVENSADLFSLIQELARLFSYMDAEGNTLLSSRNMGKIFFHSQARDLVDKLYNYNKEQEINTNFPKHIVKDESGNFSFIPDPNFSEKNYPLPKITSITKAELKDLPLDQFIENLKDKRSLLMRDPICITEINRRHLYPVKIWQTY